MASSFSRILYTSYYSKEPNKIIFLEVTEMKKFMYGAIGFAAIVWTVCTAWDTAMKTAIVGATYYDNEEPEENDIFEEEVVSEG